MSEHPMDDVDPTPLGLDDDDGNSRRVAFDPGAFQSAQFSHEARPSDQFYSDGVLPKQQFEHEPPPPKVEPPEQKPFVWKINVAPTLPEFHPVEQTAVFVPRTVPSLVARRISKILRERSIETTYDDDKAKVKCVTEEGVDFRIRLYRGRGEFSHGIIVEVQRRFGFSTAFHNETQAVLDAAQGRVPPPPVSSSLPLPPPVVSDTEDDYEPSDGSSALEMVSKMLGKDAKYDSVFLGLQTLTSLTDSSKMGNATARSVSNSLMRGESDVGGKILSLVIETKDDEMYKLRTLALTVLANAMHTAEVRVPSAVKEHIRGTLIRELKNAEKNPRMAVQAARCVECLLNDDERPSDFYDVLHVARDAGMARHVGLQRQSQVCLDMLML